MRIAIVGGGASGLVAAYLLGNRHEVHLFESAPNLGGHVRTLGLNVQAQNLPPGRITENGPLGFHVATSPTLMRLLTELEIPTKSCALGTNLFLRENRNYYLRPDLEHWRRRYFEPSTGGLKTGISLLRFLVRTRRERASRNWHKHLGEVLPHASTTLSESETRTEPFFRDWLRCIAMMCYSTPIELVDSLPAEFAAPMIRQGFLHPEWRFIPGGVFSYQAKILSQFGGRVSQDSHVNKVFRDENGVQLSVNGAITPAYDKLIIATPPGRVLSMLDRPTEVEARFFSQWRDDIPFRTIAHTDMSMYRDKNSPSPTVADYFELDGGGFGYNSCVSTLYSESNEFSFAHNLDDPIQPEKRLDAHEHRIPAYSHAALRHRQELIDANGACRTFYVGAYLGNGLHEGAVSSADQVARLLGEPALDAAGDLD